MDRAQSGDRVSDSSWNNCDFVVAQFIHSEEGFCLHINEYMSYSDLSGIIRRRFKFSANDVFHLQYSSPAYPVLYLDNDLDLNMLFCCSRIYKLDHVDVSVVKDGGSGSRTGSVFLEDCSSEIIDENDFLGAPFKDGPEKSYMSDQWSSYISHEGQKFESICDFRDKLRKYAVQTGFRFVLLKNDSNYIHAVCENMGTEHCELHVNGSVSSTNNCFYVSDLNNVHTCKGVLRTVKHKQLGSKLVRTCIESDLSYNLGFKPHDIMRKFKSVYGFDISYKVALTAKKRIVEKLYGSDADSFNMLRSYKDAVLETNPGSHFALEVDESTQRFPRAFVAYGGQVEGFKFCLPVLYVDGAHGKSIYKGQILSATGRNGNKGFFPLAMCVCDSETEDNWMFFFTRLKALLEPHERVITFISDHGHGLLGAFDKVFLGNPHLYCYHHLQFNLKDKYKGKRRDFALKDILQKNFKVAYSSTEREYYHNLRELQAEGGCEYYK